MSKTYEKTVAESAEPAARLHNRTVALNLLQEGWTPAQVVAQYPAIWQVTDEGLLRQTAIAGQCLALPA